VHQKTAQKKKKTWEKKRIFPKTTPEKGKVMPFEKGDGSKKKKKKTTKKSGR